MREVADFYTNFGVLLKWDFHYLSEAPKGQAASIPAVYFQKLRFDQENEADPKGYLEWFYHHFTRKPSVFFIGDISIKGKTVKLGQPDEMGYSYPDQPIFAFVANAGWGSQTYVFTTAHEIGHMFFGPGHTGFRGLMRANGEEPLNEKTLTDEQIAKMRQSKLLTDIPDPK